MKIAVYHPWIYLKSGLERTILEIARRSGHEILIYTSHYDSDATFPELTEFNITEVNPVSVQRSYGAVLGAAVNILKTRLPGDPDAIVVCCEGVGSFLNVRNRDKPLINLCFTPLRAVYDMEYRKRHLDTHRSRKWLALIIEFGFRWVDRLLWRAYDRVICISETVAERVLAGRLCTREDIVVSYPGIDESGIELATGDKGFFFVPGRIMWTKNIELAIQAYAHYVKDNERPLDLVIAGMVDDKSRSYLDDLMRQAADLPGISFVIGPTDEEMVTMYRDCYATLFTAFNEDLGLTPMEAMSKGKPVIAVNKGGPREVVSSDETGLLVDNDPEAFALAMNVLSNDPKMAEKFGAAGRERVSRFTWHQFVSEFDEIVSQVVSDQSASH
ncbi:MAG: glycosyltransferase family 4 protein [Pseudomonadota bacterium]